jgi:cytochrome oxidase assembly protein ShyY1
VDTNYGYMLQWWGMALAALGFGLYAARRAAKSEGKKDGEQKKDGDGQSTPEPLGRKV